MQSEPQVSPSPPATGAEAPVGIRDRIAEFRRVPAAELLDNAGNPRRHPQAQRDALRGVLEQVGVAGALLAYHSERNGGRLTLMDGHLRKEDFALDWPTLILDVGDAEADLLLATHDPLAALAEYDREKLGALLQQVQAEHQAVSQMLQGLAEQKGVATQPAPPAALPPEKFEVVVQCSSEQHQREVFDRLTGEGLTCRVLTF
jgi:hypothetical protein